MLFSLAQAMKKPKRKMKKKSEEENAQPCSPIDAAAVPSPQIPRRRALLCRYLHHRRSPLPSPLLDVASLLRCTTLCATRNSKLQPLLCRDERRKRMNQKRMKQRKKEKEIKEELI
jgi:hypothetical protein